MKIYLVDDNEDFRNTMKMFLEGHLDYLVVGEAGNGQEFLDQDIINADVVLMDINMPGINGLHATKMGSWRQNYLKIIAVSQYTDAVDIQQLIGYGFKGFVSKTNLFRDLDKAIHQVMAGGYFFPNELSLARPNRSAVPGADTIDGA